MGLIWCRETGYVSSCFLGEIIQLSLVDCTIVHRAGQTVNANENQAVMETRLVSDVGNQQEMCKLQDYLNKKTKQKSMEELVIGSNHFVVVDFLLTKKMKDCWWEQAAKNKENILAQRLVTDMKNNNKRKHVQTDVASSGKRYNTDER